MNKPVAVNFSKTDSHKWVSGRQLVVLLSAMGFDFARDSDSKMKFHLQSWTYSIDVMADGSPLEVNVEHLLRDMLIRYGEYREIKAKNAATKE